MKPSRSAPLKYTWLIPISNGIQVLCWIKSVSNVHDEVHTAWALHLQFHMITRRKCGVPTDIIESFVCLNQRRSEGKTWSAISWGGWKVYRDGCVTAHHCLCKNCIVLKPQLSWFIAWHDDETSSRQQEMAPSTTWVTKTLLLLGCEGWVNDVVQRPDGDSKEPVFVTGEEQSILITIYLSGHRSPGNPPQEAQAEWEGTGGTFGCRCCRPEG